MADIIQASLCERQLFTAAVKKTTKGTVIPKGVKIVEVFIDRTDLPTTKGEIGTVRMSLSKDGVKWLSFAGFGFGGGKSFYEDDAKKENNESGITVRLPFESDGSLQVRADVDTKENLTTAVNIRMV